MMFFTSRINKILVSLLMVTLTACSGGGGGGSNGPATPPNVIAGDNINLVIDPVKLEQPDFGQITSLNAVNAFINIRNMGSGLINPVNVSLTGIDASFFNLVNSTCPALQADGGNVCTIQIQFNPAGKSNRIYFAQLDVNGIKFPLSSELAIQSSQGVSDYQIYQDSQFVASTIDLGKTDTRVIQQTVVLRHLLRNASGNLPINMTDPNFQLSRTSCPAVEINKTGCPIVITFNPENKANRVYTAPIKIGTGNPIPISLNLKVEKASGQGAPDFKFFIDNAPVTEYSFGTVTVPEKKKITVTIKNEGSSAGVPNLNIMPNQIYMIGDNSCQASVPVNGTCSVDIYATSLNRLANTYQSKLFAANNSMTLESFVYTPNKCLPGTHLDPDSLACLADKQTEIVSNGTRSRIWFPAPLPGHWDAWTYSCLEPKFELNDSANACIAKRRNLTIETEASGTVSGGVTGPYDFDFVVTLKATPALNYVFKEWQGSSCFGSTNTCTVTMNQSHTVKAVFYVPPLQVNPNPIQVLVGSGIQLTTSGGIPAYRYEMAQDALGTVNPTTGQYSGYATPTQGAIRVRDNENRVLDVSLKVARPLNAPTTVFNVTTNTDSILGAVDGFPPYTFTKNTGVGTSDVGFYHTGSVPGSAFVTITDGLGHQKNVNVNVVAPLTVSPLMIASEVGNNIALNITAGITPYNIQLLGIPGAGLPVGEMQGQVYRTGAVPGSAMIKITDGMGSIVQIPVTVVPAFNLAEANHNMKINSSWQIALSGGLGPFTYTKVSGPGALAADGYFTAFEFDGTTLIDVTDSLGTVKRQTIKIYQPLNIGFTNFKMLVGQQKLISPTGGASPYTISLKSGLGTISGNTYSSNVVTTAVVKVVDEPGFQTAEATIEVLPEFKVPATSVNLIAGSTYQIVPSGGATPYTYQLQSGGKGIVDATGFYSTPAVQETVDVVKVSDALGNTIDVTLKVVLPLQITTTTPDIYVNQTANLQTTFGLTPYTYRVSNGSGAVSPGGVYTAPAAATVATVEVTDSMGTKVSQNISVYGEFVVSPATKNLVVGTTQQLSVSGGKPSYTYTITAGLGTISATGLFTADATNSGDVVIQVKDALNTIKTLNYKVVQPLNISPSAGVVLLTGNTVQFTPSGGLIPYSYSLTQGIGSITQAGLYSAAAQAGQAQIQLSDAMGNTKRVNIEVIQPLAVPNENIITTIGKSTTIVPSGGLAPYFFAMQSGTGTVNTSGIYTAGSAPGNDVIKVTDSSGLGQQKLIQVQIKDGLLIHSPSQYITVGNSQTYTATGGLSPYSYTVLSGRGTINQTSGVYSAGSTPGDGVVQVSDALGNTSETIVQVLAALDLTVPGGAMVVSQSKQVTGIGGLGPYSYSIASGPGSINGTGLYTAPATAGTVSIRVQDSLGQQAVKNIGIYAQLQAAQTTFERAVNQSFQVSVSGGLAPYEYYVVSGTGTISNSGLFTSNVAGSVTVKVLDALAQEVTVTGTIYSVLSISPQNSTIVYFDQQTFSGVGGKAPYTYVKVSGVGSLSGNNYLGDQVGSAVIRVTDSLGQTAQTGITINSNIEITAGNCSFSVPESVACTVGSSGGLGTRTYSVDVGTINATTGEFKGVCVANIGRSNVKVTDAQGNFKVVQLNYPCVYNGCSQILANSYGTVSGNYWIDPDGLNSGVSPEQLYCEFDSNGAWTLTTRLNTNDANSRTYFDTSFWEGSGTGTLSGTNDYMAAYFANNAGFKEIRLKYVYGTSAPDTTIESTYRLAGNSGSLRQNFLLSPTNGNSNWGRVTYGGGESTNFFGGTLIFKTTGNDGDYSRIWYNLRPVAECNQGGSIGHIGDYNSNNWTWEVARGLSDSAGGCQHNVYRLGVGSNYDRKAWGINNVAPPNIYTNGFMYIFTKDIHYYHARSCQDALTRNLVNQSGNMNSGVWTIDPDGYMYGNAPFSVVCDQSTDGGGWTIVQQRVSGSVDFYRGWADYANGFGNIAVGGNYWLGLDKIEQLAPHSSPKAIYFKFKRYNGQTAYSKYTNFSISPASNRYLLSVSGYVGASTAGDAFLAHNGYYYTTKDYDNDTASGTNCAIAYAGAWWYSACHSSNLNGLYLNGPHASYANGIEWYSWTGHYESLTESTMMVK